MLRPEYQSLLVAAILVLLVLVVSFMCLQLQRLHSTGRHQYGSSLSPSAGPCLKPLGSSAGSTPGTRERFLEPTFYHPNCSPWVLDDRRAACRGLSTGTMPSIEAGADGGALCPGALGVPP